MSSSIAHMDKTSRLTIENKNLSHREKDLQIGFTVEEMVHRVEDIENINLVKICIYCVYRRAWCNQYQ